RGDRPRRPPRRRPAPRRDRPPGAGEAGRRRGRRQVSRLVLLFVAVALIGLGAAWLADRPGSIALVWAGWRIETSVWVAAAAVVAFLMAGLLWWLVRLVLGGPAAIRALFHRRRAARGRGALTRGFVAVATGDLKTA